MNDRMTRLWATKTSDDEWWSSFVTAPLAILANYVVVDVAWLTPNLITAASFVVAFVAAGFVVVGGTTSFIIAAVLIHLSHVFDCMDGQMARYRATTSSSGGYYDKATDQIQVSLWFGAVAYAAYDQSGRVLPVFLAFIGVAFYSLRGYTKYVEMDIVASRDLPYSDPNAKLSSDQRLATDPRVDRGPPKHRSGDLKAALTWFAREQQKILRFDEGVFIFMLSLALIVDRLTPMLWVFAVSQICLGTVRAWQRGHNLGLAQPIRIDK